MENASKTFFLKLFCNGMLSHGKQKGYSLTKIDLSNPFPPAKTEFPSPNPLSN